MQRVLQDLPAQLGSQEQRGLQAPLGQPAPLELLALLEQLGRLGRQALQALRGLLAPQALLVRLVRRGLQGQLEQTQEPVGTLSSPSSIWPLEFLRLSRLLLWLVVTVSTRPATYSAAATLLFILP